MTDPVGIVHAVFCWLLFRGLLTAEHRVPGRKTPTAGRYSRRSGF